LLCELFIKVYINSLTGKEHSADIIELPTASKVTVADIDYLTSSALISPLELSHKFYILKNADTMQEAAANKLLKTLEEPPPSTKIFIVCSNERVVLPTIRSRCAVINLNALNEDALQKAIESTAASVTAANYTLAREASLGSLSRAQSILAGDYDQIFDTVFDMLLYMKNSSQILAYSSKFAAQKDNLDKLVWALNLVLHDTAKYHIGTELTLKSRRSDTAQIAQFYCIDTIMRLALVFIHTQKRLATHGNTQSIIDELLFKILEVRQKCNKQK